ncbi:unnamed protein product [Caenorhabditis bovis]|uniref:Uncharacterized protein n=1 Tax=Caenorhabditis bovis TaxID=2654633 RepID=A0A8S1E618_9PELO|nr:unnamed protein product [Caenorhabditis bovis]
MSTSALVAKTDLDKQIPSCSFTPASPSPTTPPYFHSRPAVLDVYSWSRIFEIVASTVPLRKALEFKTLHSEAYRSVDRAFRKVRKLKVEIYEANSNIYTGDESNTTPVYVVQDSATRNADTARKMVHFVLSNATCIKQLDLYFEDLDQTVLNQILGEVIESQNVKLELLHVKRRHAGQSVTKIGDLVRKNAKTLREISRIGISEASIGLNDDCNLDRLALMSFDLGFQPAPNQIPFHMIRITESEAKFRALSYTSFAGFDPTDDVVQNLLVKGCVESIKLTMMKAPKIMRRPGYMIGKVRRVKKVELVEIVPEPCRFNQLLASRHAFEKVFPYAQENIAVLQQWN